MFCKLKIKSYLCYRVKVTTKFNTKIFRDMKTLAEITDIILSNASKASKIKALVEEGFAPCDAESTYRLIIRTAPKAAIDAMSRARGLGYTVGVEIECFNVVKSILKSAIEAAGLKARETGYNHEDSETTYKLGHDGSITADSQSYKGGTCEVVTPILKNLTSLKKVCAALNEHDAKVNTTCGLHVHIGAEDFTDADWRKIVVNYGRIEPVIDSFMAKSRRADNAYYCKSVVNAARRIEAFGSIMTRRDIAYEVGDRYHKVNLRAFDSHHTIEFRQHQGTINFVKIENWIKFLIAFVNYCRTHDEYMTATTIDELPFLDDTLKAYFKGRADEFAAREGRR